jgi:hypothetical protein
LSCFEHLPRAIGYILMGYHYYRFTFETMVPELDRAIAALPAEPPSE